MKTTLSRRQARNTQYALRNTALATLLLLLSLPGFAQPSTPTDTLDLAPVHINAYFQAQPIIGLTSSAQSINQRDLQKQQTLTLLPAVNMVSGLRMEERSPGSYRVAMRGSLIRSPFGIRNTKIYVDEFALTDAGGNTYLNLMDPASIAGVDILKGPDGSLYGANSGGVIRIAPKGFGEVNNNTELLLSSGSYGMFQEQLSLQRRVNDSYSFSIDQSFTRSDGYREQTALNKKTIQTAHQWQYNPNNQLKLFLLYSDLGYETPGGLTEAQMKENPRQARPAAGPNPGAREQQAGIYNKTFYGGIAHRSQLSRKLSHVVSVFGSTTDFENPFITNYEFRDEKNLGLRTYFSYQDQDKAEFQWQMQLGFEGQKGWSKIDNYDNNKGTAADAQAKDNLDNNNSSIFYRASATIAQRLTIEGSLGFNSATISYKQRYPEVVDPSGKINFGDIWMPRIAASYLFTDNLAWRGSIAKGYSTPTLAEVRSSDNIINTDLEAESGTNYEMGIRWNTSDRRVLVDIGAYSYRMKNGIIRQLRESGAEYYNNAGAMNQKGLELALWAQLISPNGDRFVRSLSWQSSLSYNHYRFGEYVNKTDNFEGNKITAVPDWVWSNSLSVELPKAIALHLFHNQSSSMPLNDGNTIFASGYHLLQAKAAWGIPLRGKYKLQLFAGVDNLLDEEYSLGNDINAFGNRFFNPAPRRNYYGGLRVRY